MILVGPFQVRIFYGSAILKHIKHYVDDSSDLKSCSLGVPNKDILKCSHVQPAACVQHSPAGSVATPCPVLYRQRLCPAEWPCPEVHHMSPSLCTGSSWEKSCDLPSAALFPTQSICRTGGMLCSSTCCSCAHPFTSSTRSPAQGGVLSPLLQRQKLQHRNPLAPFSGGFS